MGFWEDDDFYSVYSYSLDIICSIPYEDDSGPWQCDDRDFNVVAEIPVVFLKVDDDVYDDCLQG